MRTIVLAAALMSSPVLAQVGFYKLSEPSGVSKTWGEMCIEKGANELLEVTLFGGYCPSEDCLNMRFDSMSFRAKPKNGILSYSDDKCTLRVVLRKGGAQVVQKGHCSDYDLLAGNYVKRASEVWEDDCSPRGTEETHHN
jgi:hypothetical protein